MILPKLIRHHLKHKDDPVFYAMQAEDAISWIERNGIKLGPGVSALDLGCGHGIFGSQLQARGCSVVFADEDNYLNPQIQKPLFQRIDLERQSVGVAGQFDLVICSNVLEHLSNPFKFIESIPESLTEGGAFYLSWTNWLSPWGGHEFSPFHYLGPKLGPKIFDRLTGRKRIHTPYQNLFPTQIGQVLDRIRKIPDLSIRAAAPRYYPEFKFIIGIPIFRELFTWNCALLLERRKASRKTRQKLAP